jgi:hypothetical protein
MEIPVVPSLSVLRPRRTEPARPEPRPQPREEPAPPRRDEPAARDTSGLTAGVRPDTAARVEAMHEESLRGAAEEDDRGPRSPELPSWDDILFGTRRNR